MARKGAPFDANARTVDPPSVARFKLKIDGVEIGAFTECSGLQVEVAVEEILEGGQNHFAHRVPGRMKWPNIVLKRGITKADVLFDWFKKTSGEGFAGAGNKLEQKTGSITLEDTMGKPARQWSFVGAFPVKWTGPRLAASQAAAATEELEIAHHGFTSQSFDKYQ